MINNVCPITMIWNGLYNIGYIIREFYNFLNIIFYPSNSSTLQMNSSTI